MQSVKNNRHFVKVKPERIRIRFVAFIQKKKTIAQPVKHCILTTKSDKEMMINFALHRINRNTKDIIHRPLPCRTEKSTKN